MGLLDVTFSPSHVSFYNTFLKIVMEVKASALPYVLKLWLGEGKRMLLVKYFCSSNPLFVLVKIHGDH